MLRDVSVRIFSPQPSLGGRVMLGACRPPCSSACAPPTREPPAGVAPVSTAQSSGGGGRPDLPRRRALAMAGRVGLLAALAVLNLSANPSAAGTAQGGDAVAVRDVFERIAAGDLAGAEPALTQLIAERTAPQSAAPELALLFKSRADVRSRLGLLVEAQQDLSSALRFASADGVQAGETVCVGPVPTGRQTAAPRAESVCAPVPSEAELLLQRGRVSLRIGGASALSSAVDDFGRVLEDEDGIQPYTHLFRGDAQMLLGRFSSAASDYQRATREFTSIGDAASAEVARAGWAFALYGQEGKEKEAVGKLEEVVLRTAGVNAEIELLLPLAEVESSVHVALAAEASGPVPRHAQRDTLLDRRHALLLSQDASYFLFLVHVCACACVRASVRASARAHDTHASWAPPCGRRGQRARSPRPRASGTPPACG